MWAQAPSAFAQPTNALLSAYFADAGTAGSLPTSRSLCRMMTVAWRLAAIFSKQSMNDTVAALPGRQQDRIVLDGPHSKSDAGIVLWIQHFTVTGCAPQESVVGPKPEWRPSSGDIRSWGNSGLARHRVRMAALDPQPTCVDQDFCSANCPLSSTLPRRRNCQMERQ